MSHEKFIAYWSGEEPTGPGKSPTLDETPDRIDIVPLWYVPVGPDGSFDFHRLLLHNDKATITGWMQEIRSRQAPLQRKTKFTLALLSRHFASLDPKTFAQSVKQVVDEWGVDGVTIDYEPPDGDLGIVTVVQAIREALGPDALMTAPIYGAWTNYPNILNAYASPFDYLETMDYTPYIGFPQTINLYQQYAAAIGTAENPAYEKLAIGVSCMNPANSNLTPLTDVIELCKWEPPSGKKLGIMLFTLSYDVTSHGSSEPDWAWTRRVLTNLP